MARQMDEGRVLRCFARGRDGRWEAMCIDLDIVVEAASRSEAVSTLEQAIASYVAAAQSESDPRQARRLLNRRAPWRVRLGVMASSAMHMVLRAKAGRDLRASFEVPCPA